MDDDKPGAAKARGVPTVLDTLPTVLDALLLATIQEPQAKVLSLTHTHTNTQKKNTQAGNEEDRRQRLLSLYPPHLGIFHQTDQAKNRWSSFCSSFSCCYNCWTVAIVLGISCKLFEECRRSD
jgi:hypothetical protein